MNNEYALEKFLKNISTEYELSDDIKYQLNIYGSTFTVDAVLYHFRF